MTRLRVATFNIRNGLGLDGPNLWWRRRAVTAGTIADLDADVVALQEVHGFQLRYLRRWFDDPDIDGPKIVGVARSHRGRGRLSVAVGEHCPLIVTPRIEVAAHRTRWFGPNPDQRGTRLDGAGFPRIATTAKLLVPGGESGPAHRPVMVTSTHLDEKSATNRRASAAQLLEWLDPSLPQVVMGDLNADPDSEVIDTLRRGGLELVVPEGETGTEHRFTGALDGRRIDHILVSHHFRVISARVVTTPVSPRRWSHPLPSDHWPVVADLELAP